MNFKISVIIPAYNAEDYLAETLDSLVNQTFRDFEVIIVNDGSTDGTQKIIDEYCQKYSNFKSFLQPNSGVSKARNKGIDEAAGDFLAFLDADDLFTPEALEKFYKSALENDAELVIGISGQFDSFGCHTHINTAKLGKKINIDSFEKSLIWSFSQCNKLFLRKKIIETGLKFPDLKYAEDGAFVLRFAYQCSKITGCPHSVVFYRKHDFWECISTTQKTDVEYIKDYLKAHDLIYNDAIKGLKDRIKKAKTTHERLEANKIYHDYIDELLYRRAFILFSEFYRLFWGADDNSLKLINDTILSIKKDFLPGTWLKLTKSFQDLFIDNLIYNRRAMAEHPIITIALNTEKIDEEDLPLIFDSIYAQDFPAFELLVNRVLHDKLSVEIVQNENLHFIDPDGENFKNFALKKASGRYILFVESPVILNPATLRIFFNSLYNGNYDMVSAKIRKLSDYKISDYSFQKLNCLHRKHLIDTVKAQFNYLDLNMTNKLIKIDFLRKIEFEFSDDSANDVKRLYNKAKFRKIPPKYVCSTEDEKKLSKSLKSQDKLILIKIYFLNLLEMSFYARFKLVKYFRRGHVN